MNREVADAIEDLRKAFAPSEFTVTEDAQGGAHVIIETVEIGPRFLPPVTWMGGHIPALYPAADIYPVFMGAEVRRLDGKEFEAPVTRGHTFLDRSAIQISRRNNQIHLGSQTARAKFAKILDFLGKIQ